MFFFLTTTRTEERMSMVNSRRFAFSSKSSSKSSSSSSSSSSRVKKERRKFHSQESCSVIEKTEKQKQESVMSFCARARAYLFLAFLQLFSYRSTPTTITTKITRHDDYILGILLHI